MLLFHDHMATMGLAQYLLNSQSIIYAPMTFSYWGIELLKTANSCLDKNAVQIETMTWIHIYKHTMSNAFMISGSR